MKREIGEEEFKKIEKYLIKKGLIPVNNPVVTPHVSTNATPQQNNNIIPPQKN